MNYPCDPGDLVELPNGVWGVCISTDHKEMKVLFHWFDSLDAAKEWVDSKSKFVILN